MDETFYAQTLYPFQDEVLQIINLVETGFYLTGGTAASRGYLHHRYSDDLDFFVNDQPDFSLWAGRVIQALQTGRDWRLEVVSQYERFVRLNLHRPEIALKLEFINDVPARVGPVSLHPVLGKLDSAENILANKLTALISREEPKDLADIWGFCCRMNLSIEQAIGGAQGKAAGIFPADLARVLLSATQADTNQMAKGEFLGHEGVGRFEAMNFTKGALTGNREAVNIRAQQLGTPKNAFHQVETFSPQQLKAKEAADRFMQIEPKALAAFDERLGEKGKEQVLAALKTRTAQIDQSASVEVEQADANQQIQLETSKLLQQAPENLLIGSMAVLAIWVINHLPSKVFRLAAFGTLLTFILGACSAVAPTPRPDMPNPSTPQAGEVTPMPAGATETTAAKATSTTVATAEPSPTATEQAMNLQEKVDAFAAGKIDFPSGMSQEEYSAFIDEMNNHVGRQAIWVESFDNKTKAPVVLYFDKAKNKMVKLAGTYAENKAVIDQNALEMFVKIYKEPGTGNIQYINSKGELVTSPNSADVNWKLRVDATNYESGLIDLPEVIGTGAIDLGNYWKRVFTVNNEEVTFIPGILMEGVVSNIVSNQNGWNQYPCLNMMFAVTDEQGNFLYGIGTLKGPSPATYLGYEGGTLDTTPGLFSLRATDTIKKFEAGAVYYVGISKKQQLAWNESNRASIDELQGADSAANSFDNAFNQKMPDDGIIILAGQALIKKK